MAFPHHSLHWHVRTSSTINKIDSVLLGKYAAILYFLPLFEERRAYKTHNSGICGYIIPPITCNRNFRRQNSRAPLLFVQLFLQPLLAPEAGATMGFGNFTQERSQWVLSKWGTHHISKKGDGNHHETLIRLKTEGLHFQVCFEHRAMLTNCQVYGCRVSNFDQ